MFFRVPIPAWSPGRPRGGSQAQKHFKMEAWTWIFWYFGTLPSPSLEPLWKYFVCSMNNKLIVLDVKLPSCSLVYPISKVSRIKSLVESARIQKCIQKERSFCTHFFVRLLPKQTQKYSQWFNNLQKKRIKKHRCGGQTGPRHSSRHTVDVTWRT